jgi:GNAT superfamily N-acetyltransferase
MTVRAMEIGDVGSLGEVERAAGARFREVGLDSIASDDVTEVEELTRYVRGGRGWVATADDGTVVGFAVADVVDGEAHLHEISVRPDHQGRGLGRELVGAVRDWADAAGYAAVTLTTFDQVSWNRPLYEHLGFRVLEDHEIGPGLRAIRADERASGIDVSPRVCMRLDL